MAPRRKTLPLHGFVGVAAATLGLGGGGVGLAGQEPECAGRGVLLVAVMDESGSIPIPSATVVLRWTDAERARMPLREVAGPGGELVVCAPRDARRATLWAEFGDASSEEVVVPVATGVTREVPLRLRLGEVRTGRLIGEVRDALTEDPVAAAAVSMLGGTKLAETNRRGRFILSGVPTGTHELTVRHLGYAPLSHEVDISRGITTEVEVGLVPEPVEMEPIVATATRSRPAGDQGVLRTQVLGRTRQRRHLLHGGRHRAPQAGEHLAHDRGRAGHPLGLRNPLDSLPDREPAGLVRIRARRLCDGDLR